VGVTGNGAARSVLFFLRQWMPFRLTLAAPPPRPGGGKMYYRNNYEGLDAVMAETIRIKSLSLVGKAGFTRDDLDDIRQELTLDLLTRLPGYDHEKSAFGTYVNDVVDNGIASMLEARNSAKRDWKIRNDSLNDDVPEAENEWIEQIQIVSPEDLPWNGDGSLNSPFDQCDQNVVLSKAMDNLSPRQRMLCRLLACKNVSEISSLMGISRQALYRKIARIRKKLLEMGFENLF
jgi:RNA polymerase sigma factor (sigma-70 family)